MLKPARWPRTRGRRRYILRISHSHSRKPAMMKPFAFRSAPFLAGLTLLAASGCQQTKVTPPEPVADYTRELGPGEYALRPLRPDDPQPDLQAAFNDRDAFIYGSAEQSLKWFRSPWSKQFFPFQEFSHDQAAGSVLAFKEILETSTDAATFETALKQTFDIYISRGWNDKGVVLYTGYYSPEFNASLVRTERFKYPLYKRPADLATDSVTGKPLGRRMPDGSFTPWPTRQEIDSSVMFAGTELVWMEDALDAYIVHVNGSAKLTMPDGQVMFIGYNGKTDREYVGLGASMVKAGLIDKNKISLTAIREYYKTDPQTVLDLMAKNESYVFFMVYDQNKWPSGSLGVKVTERATLATDKDVYPRGGPLMVSTTSLTLSRTKIDLKRFMFDQDTGGAIRAAGRADIYMGWGEMAEILAGGQYAEGYLYYFFLKPEYISEYAQRALAK
jgi:membrane-bound lytic murein transglycosylase A